MHVSHNVSLENYNTLRVDAKAESFCPVENESDIAEAIAYAHKHGLTIKVLGGGSNVVMSSSVNGLVVWMNNLGIQVVSQNDNSVRLKVAAGENWHDFVMWCLDQGYYGLENLALIPGSVGAAPVQNIGAYGVEVERFIEEVETFDLKEGSQQSFSRAQCQFSYRESIFKNQCDGQYIISNVLFTLSKQPSVEVAYAPLNQMAEVHGTPCPKQLAQWVVEVRNQKLPNPSELPNAGSFFKNPVLSQAEFKLLQEQFADIPSYAQPSGVKVPAGWLIDQLGLKGHDFGRVKVHDKQALVLINQGGTAQDIAEASAHIQRRVKQVYGIELEQEPRMFT